MSSAAPLKSFFVDNSDPEKGISLCIPRVFNNISWRRIKETFIRLGWGFVERIDVVPVGQFKRAFIHFAPGRWNTSNREAQDALTALTSGDEVKIVYDDPWFWKIGISHAKRPTEAPKPKPRPTVKIAPSESSAAASAASSSSSSAADVVVSSKDRSKVRKLPAKVAVKEVGKTNNDQ